MDPDPHACNPGQAGTSLVEVLVTLVLVSVGLLGMAGLQVAALQNSSSAAQRYEATTLARDILERMRANRPQALAGAYDIALGALPVGGGRADTDLTEWKNRLASMPSGDGAVALGGDGIATITVQWGDASDDGPGASRTGTVLLRTEL